MRNNSAPPNVILIICDDLNDSLQGMGGHPQAQTPNLDRLMKQGVQFSHAYSNVPLCGPSRASCLTGLYPHTTGYYSNKNNWARMRKCPKLKNSVTFMEHFWNQGYGVYGTGKINHNTDSEPHIWKKQDGTPTYGGNMNWGPWPSNGNGREGFRGPLHPAMPKTASVDNMFASLANIPSFPADSKKNIPGYTGWVLQGKPFRYRDENDRDRMPDELSAEYAVKVIQEKHDDPYFLCVGLNRPHAPLIAPQKYFDRFPLNTLKLPVIKNGDIADCSGVLTRAPDACTGNHGLENYNGIVLGGGKPLLKKWLQAYLACVAFCDDQVGTILDAYENSPDQENTYLIFVSDHGYHMGEKKTLYKMTLWEEAGRIPFLVAGRGVAQGAVCDRPISLIDLYPTMTDLCSLPSNPNQKTNGLPLDGHSLKPLLEDPRNGQWEGPEVALTEIANANRKPKPSEIHPSHHHFAVRSKRYRYILCNNGEEELYDHQIDPYEWKNLAKSPQQGATKEKLRRQLFRLTGQNQESKKPKKSTVVDPTKLWHRITGAIAATRYPFLDQSEKTWPQDYQTIVNSDKQNYGINGPEGTGFLYPSIVILGGQGKIRELAVVENKNLVTQKRVTTWRFLAQCVPQNTKNPKFSLYVPREQKKKAQSLLKKNKLNRCQLFGYHIEKGYLWIDGILVHNVVDATTADIKNFKPIPENLEIRSEVQRNRVIRINATTGYPYFDQADNSWSNTFKPFVINDEKKRFGLKGPADMGMVYPSILILDQGDHIRLIGQIEPAEHVCEERAKVWKFLSESLDNEPLKFLYLHVPHGLEAKALDILERNNINYSGLRGYSVVGGKLLITLITTLSHGDNR